MSKNVSAFAIALLLSATPIAFAAQDVRPSGTTQGEEVIQPNQMRASKMIGSAVYDRQNRDIGKVTDLIVDQGGKIDAVIVDVGSFLGMGGKNVALKPNELKTDNNRLTLDVTREQLQQKAEYSLKDRNTGAGTSASPVTGGKIGGSGR
jgi:sporulation protein YlmC with PRC-barrel domain